MAKKIASQKSLIASVIVLILCTSLLVGSTFAWFVDTSATGVNTIQAGTLDVDLEMKEDDKWVNAEGKTLHFLKTGSASKEEALWEPGCTYYLPQLRVRNNGNLWLKFEVAITGINSNAKLNEAITWSYGGVAKGALAPNDSEVFVISGHMDEAAGNEYQDLSIKDISITVYATQYPHESDSFGNQYDAFAELPTLYENTNLTTDTEGKHFVGTGSTTMTSTYWIVDNTVENYIIDAGIGNAAAASIVEGNNVFNNCTFRAEGTNTAFWADYVEEGATITFNNCTFDSAIKLGGDETNKYVFNNCKFSGIVPWNKGLITAYSPIELNGCTFDRTAGALYDVYKAIGLSDDIVTITDGEAIVAGKADAVSSVIAVRKTPTGVESVKVAANTAELAAAYADSSISRIYLGSGMYALPAVDVSAAGKTLIGNGKTQIYDIAALNHVSIENCKITYAPASDANASLIYGACEFIRCTFTGVPSFVSAPAEENATVTFEGCTFKQRVQLGYKAGVRYDFKGCAFEGYLGEGVANVTTYAACEFKDCTFSAEYGVQVITDHITAEEVILSGTTATQKK